VGGDQLLVGSVTAQHRNTGACRSGYTRISLWTGYADNPLNPLYALRSGLACRADWTDNTLRPWRTLRAGYTLGPCETSGPCKSNTSWA